MFRLPHRVVITGMGVITPIGKTKKDFWESLIKGRSGVRKLPRFEGYASFIGAPVEDFCPEEYMEKRDARRMDRFTQFAYAAASMALNDASIDPEKAGDKSRIGVIIGTGIGGISTIEEQIKVLLEKGPRRVSPFFIPSMIANMAAGYISIAFGLHGPNTTIVTACASGTHALGEAFRIIQRGDADIMLAGGAEAPLTDVGFAGFTAMKAMSTRNGEPERASRPFDLHRDGFVIGEGAGVLVLETLESARSRGAFIYGEVAGYGMSGDAYHLAAPDPQGEGAYICMKRALEDASLEPEKIDYINAHGTSTEHNDKVETIAIKRAFGEYAYKIPISSTKSMIGHLMGAGGGVEIAATLLSMLHGIVPPTINYEFPDPECDLFYVPNKPCEKEIKAAISNSFGFGGTNASILIKAMQNAECRIKKTYL